MNIEIVGILLERLTALVASLRTESSLLVHEVIRRGLEVMECDVEKKDKSAEPRPLGSSKAYVKEHWKEQTDREIAAVLGIQVTSVAGLRNKLGLRRRDLRGAVSAIAPASNGTTAFCQNTVSPVSAYHASLLSDEAKAEITAHPELSHEELALQFKTSPDLVKKLRMSLASEFLEKGEWQKETDGGIGARFGLKDSDIGRLRRTFNLMRIRGQYNSREGESSAEKYIVLLGGFETIKEALTNGGKNIVDLFHDKGITTAEISREWMRRVVGTIGLTGNESQHTSLWYANRILGPDKAEIARELATPESFRKQLAEAGGCAALSKKLGVAEHKLRVLAEKIGLVSEEDKVLIGGRRPELVPIICSYCNTTFYRSKIEVEREKRVFPDRVLHFCNKSHQGFYVAEHHGFKPGEVRGQGRRKAS